MKGLLAATMSIAFWSAPTLAQERLDIIGTFCPDGLDSEGYPPAEFRIGNRGVTDAQGKCEIISVVDIGDGWFVAEQLCGSSKETMDIKLDGQRAVAVIFQDGHEQPLKRCEIGEPDEGLDNAPGRPGHNDDGGLVQRP